MFSLFFLLAFFPFKITRGLDFTAQALRHNVTKPDEELAASFRAAYATTLKPHHGILVRPVFSAAMVAMPYRRDFYAKLGDGSDSGANVSANAANADAVQRELQRWLDALEQRVGILKTFQARKEAQW
jgi:hypothetical protein